ncbi:ABC transporter ATP-binding protein [Paracoccus siganidrum]|uniref:ATP-binding cassette domain-containing protein n=1 Tax=Paracoccus siganidrum TaxID=1276757 RepID=A0A419A3F4_9RHOB|nr:ATP-binding cassette domain-containing protein [Paracoccus siganidrum]RJL08203.1 ATP-binding cassette domain-containing protein [Paracoccus siganidrum]RMC34646.1 ABC transporter ATP-binding protein [Paracoccus siganidrum]
MIQITGVSHRIGTAPILHDITAAMPAGRLTALIGPNGAGKSTLLRLIGRLEPCQAGRIEVDGLDVGRTPTERLALKLAILGQQTHIASRLRLRELVGFGRWPHHRGRPGPADQAAVEAALDAFGLAGIAGRFLDEVSGGQRQRAHIAMSFAQATDWLLLDEPLNNLDMAHARALMARLRGLVRDGGRSAVMVVHEINYAAAWADHIIAMKDGRIAAEGPPEAVLTEAVLSGLYDTPVSIGSHLGRPLVLHHA